MLTRAREPCAPSHSRTDTAIAITSNTHQGMDGAAEPGCVRDDTAPGTDNAESVDSAVLEDQTPGLLHLIGRSYQIQTARQDAL